MQWESDEVVAAKKLKASDLFRRITKMVQEIGIEFFLFVGFLFFVNIVNS